MVKRLFDIVLSVLGLILLLPIFVGVVLWVYLDSKGAIFYKQIRVGIERKEFVLYKFRTMYKSAEQAGLLTVGMRDNRITKAGYYLRKYKVDELPQLLNVLKGDMSIVGPRPEVPKYVALYSEEQLKVLRIKPGLTDYASIEYANENEILSKSLNPEEAYVKKVMPAKLNLNALYIEQMGLVTDMKIIFKTFIKILS